jgi:hypothetical protein
MKNTSISKHAVKRHAFKSLFLHQIRDIEELGEMVERLLKKEVHSLSEMVTEKTSCLPFPERDELLGWYDGDLDQLTHEFPRLQRYALFATAMGMIESHLHFLCKHAQQICGIQIAVSDLNGKGVVRAMTYLTKVCRFRISTGQRSEADHLTMLQKMRNAIIHNEGTPPDCDLEAIRQYRKRCPHFDLSTRNQIRPKESFLGMAIHLGQLLVTTIIAEIEKAERRAQQGAGVVREPRCGSRAPQP